MPNQFRAADSPREFIKTCGHILGIGSAMKVGVFLGLGGGITIDKNTIYTEAGSGSQGLPLVEKFLEHYLEGLPEKDDPYVNHFKSILEATKITNEYCHDDY